MLVREATSAGASALAVAQWRNLLGVAALLPALLATLLPPLLPPFCVQHERQVDPCCTQNGRWGAGDVAVVGVAGVLLAVHFGAWTAALGRTTVANTSAIVAAQPAVTLLLGHLVLGERLTRRTALLVGVAVAGAAIVGGADLAGATGRLDGNGLAAVGTLAGAAYLVAGRRARRRLALVPYAAAVFAVCAAALTGARLVGGDGLGLPWAALGWVLALTAAGQLAGHVVFNLLLAHLPAWAVAVTGAGEAVGATALAWWVLAEAPTPGFWLGAPLVLGAIVLAVPSPGRGTAPA